MFKRQSDTKYRHIMTEEKVILGIDKEMSEDDVSLLTINPMQTTDSGLFGEIMSAGISLRDRSVLIGSIEQYARDIRSSKRFNGRYWDILLDFLYAIYNKTLYEIATDMIDIYPDYEPKNIFDTLDKLKHSKGNIRDFSQELVKILCCYCRVTEDILRFGNGYLYVIEDTEKYTLKEIQRYCNNHKEIDLKEMIMDIAGVGDAEVIEIPLQIGIEINNINENIENFVRIILKRMSESGV